MKPCWNSLEVNTKRTKIKNETMRRDKATEKKIETQKKNNTYKRGIKEKTTRITRRCRTHKTKIDEEKGGTR